MLYPKAAPGNLSVPPVTGGQVQSPIVITCQPSTWPHAPKRFNLVFHTTFERILQETMLNELRNVVNDIQKANDSAPFPLVKRGHVVGVAYMCALDAVSSYGYGNRKRVAKFVRNHFPADYKRHANRIYPDYRISLVHEWNLFGTVAMLPGNEPIQIQNGSLQFGLLNFMGAFEYAVQDFLTKLKTDSKLQARTLTRYREVTGKGQVSRPYHTNRMFMIWMIGFAIGIATAFIVEALRKTP